MKYNACFWINCGKLRDRSNTEFGLCCWTHLLQGLTSGRLHTFVVTRAELLFSSYFPSASEIRPHPDAWFELQRAILTVPKCTDLRRCDQLMRYLCSRAGEQVCTGTRLVYSASTSLPHFVDIFSLFVFFLLKNDGRNNLLHVLFYVMITVTWILAHCIASIVKLAYIRIEHFYLQL